MEKNFPLVSIVIPNWNGKEYLKTLLPSLYSQTYKNIELIIVDCVSSDDSVQFIKKNYPNVKLVELKEDKGPANALNVGVKNAKGEYILFLNNDVILPPDCVKTLVLELQKDENCVISPLEFYWDKTYHRAGGSFSLFHGLLWKIFKVRPSIPPSPLWPLAACCITTKEIIKDIPPNDNLFMYEEFEWGLRLHLKKVKIKICPDTYYLHKFEGTSKRGSPKQSFYYAQLMITSFFICFKLPTLILLFPLISLWYLRNLGAYLKNRQWKSFVAHIKGFLNFWLMIKLFWKDRIKTQKERLIGDWELIKIMEGSLIFERECFKKFSKNA